MHVRAVVSINMQEVIPTVTDFVTLSLVLMRAASGASGDSGLLWLMTSLVLLSRS